MPSISTAKVLIIASDGFEQTELMTPQKTLSEAGATVHVASPDGSAIKGWDVDDWGTTVKADRSIEDVSAADYDVLVLPGGQINPDVLRVNGTALSLIKAFAEAGKPIAAICHAPWLLIETGLIKGHRATSYKSIKTDVANAGATWVDEKVVVDGGLVTSRNPDDLDAFCAAIIEVVEKDEGYKAAA